MALIKNGGPSILEDKEKLKRMIKIVIVLLVILLIANIALIFAVYYVDLQTLKISINGQKVKDLPDDLFIFEESGDIYVAIKSFSSIIGYKTQNGGYKDYSESLDECYIENDNEVAEFSLDSNRITKYNKNTNTYEYFDIQKPVKRINEALYVNVEGISIGDNIRMSFNKESNKLDIITLEYYAQTKITEFEKLKYKSALNTTEGQKIEDTSYFNNLKAILYNMMVVKDTEGRLGVCDLSGKEIIGTKYKSIEFIESSKDFIVQTEEGKVGIISKEASFIIRPEYDSIKQMDSNLGLYIVTTNQKEGVVDKNGKIIIYPEYDMIGIENFKDYKVLKNQYLLFDKYVPVSQNNKWGWIDVETGKKIRSIQFDDLGCRNNYTTEITADPVLIIPDYEAIVVKVEDKSTNKNEENYYILKITGEVLINEKLDRVYSITSSGTRQYYMSIGDKTNIDIEQYLTDKGILKVNY